MNATILGYLLGAEVSLEADIESAPSAMDGTFTWSCDKAEFKQGDTWTPRMGQGKSITVRFTEPSNEHHVDVTYQPTAAGSAKLTALRWDADAEEYVSDRAVFAVTGFTITKKPEYAINGKTADAHPIPLDLNGKRILLEAKAYPGQ